MSIEHDQITEFHYSAFHPSLHSRILNHFFRENEKYYFWKVIKKTLLPNW